MRRRPELLAALCLPTESRESRRLGCSSFSVLSCAAPRIHKHLVKEQPFLFFPAWPQASSSGNGRTWRCPCNLTAHVTEARPRRSRSLCEPRRPGLGRSYLPSSPNWIPGPHDRLRCRKPFTRFLHSRGPLPAKSSSFDYLVPALCSFYCRIPVLQMHEAFWPLRPLSFCSRSCSRALVSRAGQQKQLAWTRTTESTQQAGKMLLAPSFQSRDANSMNSCKSCTHCNAQS